MPINTLQKTNTKKLTINSFIFLGAIASGIVLNEDLFASMGILMTPAIYLQLTLRNKIKNNKDLFSIFNRDVLSLELSNKYLIDFSNNLFKYIDESNSYIERKSKLVFTLLWLKNVGSFKSIFENLSTNNKKEKKIIEKYKSLFIEFDLNDILTKSWDDTEIIILNQSILTSSSENDLEIIKKVYKDFEKYGFLGQYILDIKRPLINLIFNLQEYKFNYKDINNLKNSNIINDKSYDKYVRGLLEKLCEQITKDKKHLEYLEKIVVTNNEYVLNVLNDFYKKLNKNKSFDETIFILESSMHKKELEKTLPKKTNNNNKVQKI